MQHMNTYNVYVIGKEGKMGRRRKSVKGHKRLIWEILMKHIIYIYKNIIIKPLFYMISIC